MAAQKQGAARGTAVLRCVGCLQLPPTVDTHALRISYPPTLWMQAQTSRATCAASRDTPP